MMRMTMMQEAHDVRLPEYVGDLWNSASRRFWHIANFLFVEFKICFWAGEMSNMQGWAAQPLIPASPTRYPESHVL